MVDEEENRHLRFQSQREKGESFPFASREEEDLVQFLVDSLSETKITEFLRKFVHGNFDFGKVEVKNMDDIKKKLAQIPSLVPISLKT